MRDVSAKFDSLRIATAEATVRVSPSSIAAIREGRVPKGDPLPVARVAAVLAAKATPQLIPYCHSVPLDQVTVDFELREDAIIVTATAKAIYTTGVEMEALTAASVAALNLYDILKMIDEEMAIESVRLVSKEGGKGDFRPDLKRPLRGVVIVVSDSVAAGTAEDRSGAAIRERLEEGGLTVDAPRVVPDEPERLALLVRQASDEERADLIVTTGGTGVGPRDRTPEVVAALLERDLPGVAEAIRAYGQRRNAYAMLSRTVAGVRGQSLVLCLPGSTSGVRDALSAVFPAVLHALAVMDGEGHGPR